MDGPLAGWGQQGSPTALTVGVFDGVHIGHRRILERLAGRGLSTTVLTFEPHPAEVLSPGTDPRLITSIEERVALLERAGVDAVGVLDLSEIRDFEPERFVAEVLVGSLAMSCMVIGSDFHFGRNRAGDVSFLRDAGERHGFDLVVVDLVATDGVVTSSRIRGLIAEGEVLAAAALLGSRYRLSNVVTRGEKRGTGLGFPTANLRPPARKVIPAHGIYAAFAEVGEQRLPAAVSVGVRPTFGGGELLIEAYLLDFDGDLYGKVVALEFVERIRPELRFDTADALVDRMSEDVAAVREILNAVAAL
jgi:riboflavin kinase/FMN adenylyltransferase